MKKANIIAEKEYKDKMKMKLDEIQQKSSKLANAIIQKLKSRTIIKETNNDVMFIYNLVYTFTESTFSSQTHFDPKSNKLYEQELLKIYEDLLTEFIKEMNSALTQCYAQKDSILATFIENFHNYKAYSSWLYKMYQYLDQFVTDASGTTLKTITLTVLKNKYFDIHKKTFLNSIFEFILDCRQNNIPLSKELKQMIELFEVLGAKKVDLNYIKDQGVYRYTPKTPEQTVKYYQDEFQRLLLNETERFYSEQIKARSKYSTPEFVNWGFSILEKEDQMAQLCYSQSRNAIRMALEQCLIKSQAQNLVNSQTGVCFMLQSDRFEELHTLYNYLKRIKDTGVPHLARAYQQYFEQKGSLLNQVNIEQNKSEKPMNVAEVYFQNILSEMKRAKQILEKYLNDDLDIQKSYNVAFSVVLNKNEKTPLWLAIYSDIILRSDKGINEAEMDERAARIVSLFQLIYSRDIFFKHYQKFLSLRLLNIANLNLQQEKQQLSKFKGETGTSALSQLQSMIVDIEQSQRFASDIKLKEKNKFELNVSLLSMGAWPISSVIDSITVNPILSNALMEFQELYLQAHQGRLVSWAYNYGQGDVVFKTKSEKYFLNLSTLQIVIFFLFNQGDSFSVKQIKELTKIPQIELENSLIPFVCLKLIKRSQGDLMEFSDEEEVFTLITNFQNKAKKIKLLPNPKMQPHRQQKVQEIDPFDQQQIQKQREFVVDSQLVRILKSRKTIKHNELVESCQQMVTIFKPEVLFCKKRIENLIEREYIKRDEKDWYSYYSNILGIYIII